MNECRITRQEYERPTYHLEWCDAEGIHILEDDEFELLVPTIKRLSAAGYELLLTKGSIILLRHRA